MIQRTGYIGVFLEPLTKEEVEKLVVHWINRFDRVEQVIPGQNNYTSTMLIEKIEDIFYEEHPQFRVIQGDDFSWVYLSYNRQIIETSGFYSDQIPLSLEVLLELPNLVEVVEETNEKRLKELEDEGFF
ncbi:hypothetical protein [Methylacidiphilum caldifontis]|uniref:Uncharacterized protein n=1 Tax=Methylacidiphilum caldifontis TaxID=2795386 RepID=A0A4Y8PDK2_9BACT|nr:hypothetical protein [Methylacidiphilum caldifontis]QSR88037.1 hypothetical protein IT6_06465 [Methylacidiphilum caldifontis]TFE69572.1 hypothetical protein A7Q10_06915 [Methylacidiphilum caldifontis]